MFKFELNYWNEISSKTHYDLLYFKSDSIKGSENFDVENKVSDLDNKISEVKNEESNLNLNESDLALKGWIKNQNNGSENFY